MDADDLAHDAVDGGDAAIGGQAEGGDVFALVLDGGLGHPGHVDELAGGLGHAGILKFVGIALGQLGNRGGVHGVLQIVRNHVIDELAGAFDVLHGVFPVTEHILVGGENDHGGVKGQVGELAVGGQVVAPVLILGGDPADDPGDRAGFEGVFGQTVVVLFRLVKHKDTSMLRYDPALSGQFE